MSLYSELKRRNVLKVSMAYLALCWLVVEVTNTITPLLELPDYYFGYAFVAMNAVGLGRLDEAREAIQVGLRIQPELSLELVQGIYGVERPEVDARRNAALRAAGLGGK